MPFIIDNSTSGPSFGETVRQSLEVRRTPSTAVQGRRTSAEMMRRGSGDMTRTSGDKRELARQSATLSQRNSEEQMDAVKRLSMDVSRVSVEVQRRRKQEGKPSLIPDPKAEREDEHDHTDKPDGPEEVQFEQAPHEGLTDAQAAELLAKWGRNELTEKTTPKWLIFVRLLIGPMPIMLWLAALIELIIGNYADMAILLVIQFTNACISFYETTKAGDAVAALKASKRILCRMMLSPDSSLRT